MKLDYNFIKKILLTIEEYNLHEIANFKLMEILGVSKEQEDKFIGHILILGDNNFIDSVNKKFPFGFAKAIKSDVYQIVNDKYRITAQGYEFLDVLKKDNIFNQIADLAVPTAFKIGTQLLTQTLWEKIKNGV